MMSCRKQTIQQRPSSWFCSTSSPGYRLIWRDRFMKAWLTKHSSGTVYRLSNRHLASAAAGIYIFLKFTARKRTHLPLHALWRNPAWFGSGVKCVGSENQEQTSKKQIAFSIQLWVRVTKFLPFGSNVSFAFCGHSLPFGGPMQCC